MCAFLRLRSNQLASLPDLSMFPKLVYLDCSSNQLTSLPGLSALTRLRELNCPYNFLTRIPDLSEQSNFLKTGISFQYAEPRCRSLSLYIMGLHEQRGIDMHTHQHYSCQAVTISAPKCTHSAFLEVSCTS